MFNSDYQPLVSVIVPSYNHSIFLKQRLDSIFNQTYSNFEVIILDDASTDNSLDIIAHYTFEKRFKKLIINERNSGSLFRQWRKGLEQANGDFIWIAETDDFADKNFLKEVILFYSKNIDITLCYTDSVSIDGNVINKVLWSEIKNTNFKTNRWSHDYVNNSKNEILDFLIHKTTINNISAVVFRREVFGIELLRQVAKFKNVGDLFLYLTVSLKSKLGYLSKPLCYCRSHENNLTKGSLKSGLLSFERLKCYIKFFIFTKNELNRIEIKLISRAYKKLLVQNMLKLNYTEAHKVQKILKISRGLNLINSIQYFNLVIILNLFFRKWLSHYKSITLIRFILR